ncbi:MAG: hypothetical protein H6806_12630 [Planctomycetes bacterium]|nr:hypothetical protein [Planctomycetota bacterium]
MGNIPVGTTEGTVVQHQLGKSPKSGSQRIEVLFEDDQGNRSWWHGYLHTDKTFGRTVEALEFLGWDADACQGDLMSLHGTQVLRGARAELVVEDASFVGNDGQQVHATRVAWVNGGGLRGDAMPEDEARAFASQLRARVLARKGPRPSTRPGPSKAPARAAASSEPSPDDPDFPF